MGRPPRTYPLPIPFLRTGVGVENWKASMGKSRNSFLAIKLSNLELTLPLASVLRFPSIGLNPQRLAPHGSIAV